MAGLKGGKQVRRRVPLPVITGVGVGLLLAAGAFVAVTHAGPSVKTTSVSAAQQRSAVEAVLVAGCTAPAVLDNGVCVVSVEDSPAPSVEASGSPSPVVTHKAKTAVRKVVASPTRASVPNPGQPQGDPVQQVQQDPGPQQQDPGQQQQQPQPAQTQAPQPPAQTTQPAAQTQPPQTTTQPPSTRSTEPTQTRPPRSSSSSPAPHDD